MLLGDYDFPAHLLRVIGGLILLLIPGLIAFRGLLPDGSFPEALGMVPALAASSLAIAAIAVIAVARSPFSLGLALASVVVAAVAASLVGGRAASGLPFTSGGRAARS